MAVYGVTIFIGAFLLFQVQPMIGKYILPWFGGAPSVWTTCMLFFQVVLLAGYAYAHLVSNRLKLTRQAVIHLSLTAAALVFLPAIPSEAWKPNSAADPTWRIIGLLCATIGLPYLVLAATSPLLQHWFTCSDPQKSPYRLYALSNVGSLLALATYPTFLETHFTRQSQAKLWALGLVAYGASLALCAWKVCSKGSPNVSKYEVPIANSVGSNRKLEEERRGRNSILAKILWVALPACASTLLLATTNKLCQEVAVVPFLWVVPLGLYLLSFIICFDSPRWYRRFPFGLAMAAVMGAVCWVLFHPFDVSVRTQMVIYAAACFICCMVCHGEVYRLRPEATGLTQFYLLIAAGGALGGLFVGIAAPVLFNDYFELQWGLGVCGVLFLMLVAHDWWSGRLKVWRWKPRSLASWGCLATMSLSLGWASMVSLFWLQAHRPGQVAIFKTRNFYGVLAVFERTEPVTGMRVATLVHGRTTHGLQFRDSARASWPTAYYGQRSGVGLALQQFPAGSRRIGLVGLGSGTLATYGQPGDYFRIYEINPAVERLARTQFTYLSNCRAKAEVVLGDARLSLEQEQAQGFDLLVLDAFSSDAIPAHLLTEEAFRVYQRHLKANGFIAVHVSNRSLDLEPVVANVAARLGYVATLIDYLPPRETGWVFRSRWVLLSRGEAGLQLSRCCRDARAARADLAQVPLWNDDFTSLFQILWRRSADDVGPCTAELEFKSAEELVGQGKVAEAIEHYRAALESEPDLVVALNNLAWILATTSDASLRNGAEAVKCAQRACELTNFRTTLLVGTLAAAYAEAGRFTEAIATAEKACQLATSAGDTKLLWRNQDLLKLYRTGKQATE